MKVSELFNELSSDDLDFEEARKIAAYKTFDHKSKNLSLNEYIDTVHITTPNSSNLRFSERLMIDKYVNSGIAASSEYVDKMNSKLKELKNSIPNKSNSKHIHSFLNTLINHLEKNTQIVPKEVIEYLNTLYTKYKV